FAHPLVNFSYVRHQNAFLWWRYFANDFKQISSPPELFERAALLPVKNRRKSVHGMQTEGTR
ncbi:MAG: hypothetical protein KAI73_09825, partial [Rhodospirillaceae bacterium]|nr:hypothetical protein [Rhodospirillaceae bacterium]